MISLNSLESTGNADRILRLLHEAMLIADPNIRLIGVEMGVAYGGGVEALGKLWKGRGDVFGYDTFEGHPKHLAPPGSQEGNCLDPFYSQYGVDKLSYDYQRSELDVQGLDNVHLVKGLIDQRDCQHLPVIHYCLLDLDMLASMEVAYLAVKDKIAEGGFLCMHDVINGFENLSPWYLQIKSDPMWKVVFEGEKELLSILRKVNK